MSNIIDRTTKYARQVVSGNIITGKWVKKACERHLRDIKESKKYRSFEYKFDIEKAEASINFFPLLKHSKGELAGQPIELEPWEAFIIGSTFGWVNKKTELRRFKTSFNMVARKNGKSTVAAGVGLKGLIADGEAGAEIYTAAVKKDQAKIIFEEAKRMAKASKHLLEYVEVLTNNINMKVTNSKFEPLSSDSKSLDGLNVHFGLIDELHAHPTRKVYDLIEGGTASRSQPLIFVISTAGEETVGNICYEKYEYAQKVLDGIIEDDSFFAYVAHIDEDDDWKDPKVWIKANPNLGVSVKPEYLETKAKQALQSNLAQANFMRKHLNIFVQGHSKWMNMDKWKQCLININELPNLSELTAYAGVDLSAKYDLTSTGFIFPYDDDKFIFKSHSFMPEDRLEEKIRLDNVPYDIWAKAGWITLTPGDVVDYDWIIDYLINQNKLFKIEEVAFDPWNSTQFANDLQNEGFTTVEINQTLRNLSEPTKNVMELILAKKAIIENNPVLNWAVSNAVAKMDANENIMLNKGKSVKRIDPIAAIITGHVRAILEKNSRSIYETRGILTT